MKRHRSIAVLVALATLLTAGAASAQEHRRPRHLHLAAVTAPPLTIQKRSFLDPGNVVPVGSQNDYFVENSSFAQPITSSYTPDKFGEAVLPGRFDLPNNPRYFPQQDLDVLP